MQAQGCGQSIVFADDFESDPSSRWTIRGELTNPATFVPRDWTWVNILPDDRPGSAFFAPDPAAPELCSAPAPGQRGVLLLESPPITLPGYFEHYGGPTMTHELLVNSPAINAGDPNFNPYVFNPPLLYDQRNSGRFPRIAKGRIDVGAYEHKSP